jgi:sigma-B regulation protein RsbU (phosphoserine phosphatase)
MPHAWKQYGILAVLFCWALFYQVGNISYIVRILLHADGVPSAPFTIRNATRTIGSGPLLGDEILSLNGRPLMSKTQFDDAVARAHPGDRLRLVLSQPSGRAIEASAVIGDKRADVKSTGSVILILCLNVLVPIVCLGLGFAVAFIRPLDWNAWLLLFLLIGFSGLVSGTDWQSSLPDLQFLWSALSNSVWPVAMVLFSIYFPSRLALDQRFPRVKYILLAPVAAIELILYGILWIWIHDISAAQNFQKLYARLTPLNLVGLMISVGTFFAVLGFKSGTVKMPDDRRRLRILRTGASVSLTPMGLIVLYSVIRQTDLLTGVPWPIAATALCMNALFPLTLAYVIVVERAMDLSFVVRQSVKYGLARGGLWVLRGGVALYAFNSLRHSTTSRMVPVMGLGIMGLIMLRSRNASRASVWLDRKFFREAYNAEQVLAELAVEAGSYVEIEPLLEKVARRISDTLHVSDIVILVREGNIYKTRYSTRPGQPMDIAARGHLLTAGEGHEPLEVHFDKPQPWIRSLGAEELQTLDFMRSQLLLTLRGRGAETGQIVGLMSLGAKKSEEPYSKTDIRLLQAVAVQMGMALENSRLMASLAREAAHREVMDRELEIAREVQERLFPQTIPQIPGTDCFGYCRPARGVGGDYYDFLELPGGKLGIAIGDVSGKGIAAALLMASLQASLRGQAMAGLHDLAELMRNVNKLVYDASQSNRYATFFYGELDPSTRQFAYVNAGHNAPVILRGTDVIRLEASGPVVGLLPCIDYIMESCQLQPGDIFIGYTDGICEAMNEQDEEWDEERFIAAGRQCAQGTAREMIDAVFRSADTFTGAAKQYDDMTLLVMKLQR